jgi:hypothetical protein
MGGGPVNRAAAFVIDRGNGDRSGADRTRDPNGKERHSEDHERTRQEETRLAGRERPFGVSSAWDLRPGRRRTEAPWHQIPTDTVFGPVKHYQFVTGSGCMNVLTGVGPTFEVVDRVD